MKILFIAAAMAAALTITAPASATFTMTGGPANIVPAGQTVVCDGTALMCAASLTGPFAYTVAPDSSPAISVGEGEEAFFAIGKLLNSLSFASYSNSEYTYARLNYVGGLYDTLPGNAGGATRFIVDFNAPQFVESISFGSDIGDQQWGSLTLEVVTPVGGVPEPASWAMMIAGFGLVGNGMRRQRQRLVVA